MCFGMYCGLYCIHLIINRKEENIQLIHQILNARNLPDACKEVVRNKGAAGVDKMDIKQLEPYLKENREKLIATICSGNYHALPIRGKKIPKSSGKKQLLGIPKVVDRMLQHAAARKLMNHYEFLFCSQLFFFNGVHELTAKGWSVQSTAMDSDPNTTNIRPLENH
jgi:RNA-directed DNA polymerase